MANFRKAQPVKRAQFNKNQSMAARLLRVVLLSLGSGVAVCAAALSVFALLFTHTPLSLNYVEPLACIGAALGVLCSARVLAGGVGRQKLLCGLVCGVFYAVAFCLAMLVEHWGQAWQAGFLTLPVALLCSGVAGGALAALREGR